MVYHFPSSRELASRVLSGGSIEPPAGWYFEGIISICGSHPPFNGPLAVERDTTPVPDFVVMGDYSVEKTHFFLPAMDVNLTLTPNLLEVVKNASEVVKGNCELFVVMSIRPKKQFEIAPFASLDLTKENVIVTEFWSVFIDTENASLRESYFPALRISDSLKELSRQNEELKAGGHELMVRYYRLD